jgi:hypothetical protein
MLSNGGKPIQILDTTDKQSGEPIFVSFLGYHLLQSSILYLVYCD